MLQTRGWAGKIIIAGSDILVGIKNCNAMNRKRKRRAKEQQQCFKEKKKIPTAILPVMELTSPDTVKQEKKEEIWTGARRGTMFERGEKEEKKRLE